MEASQTYLAFAGVRCVAKGPLALVLPILKQRFEQDRSETVLVFEIESGRQVDFDLRGTLEEVLERASVAPAKGPGRPKLGVTSREVSLLPRQWDWLEQQPSGLSEHAVSVQVEDGGERLRIATSRQRPESRLIVIRVSHTP